MGILPFTISHVLFYVITFYWNIMYKSTWLERFLMKNDNFDQSKVVIFNALKDFQPSGHESKRKLFWVNLFCSIYILDVVFFIVALFRI